MCIAKNNLPHEAKLQELISKRCITNKIINYLMQNNNPFLLKLFLKLM